MFAERAFTGKGTAVFVDARGLDAAQMRLIARELRFPQTAFIFRSARPDTPPRVRVFTPTAELPRAEHLSIAAVCALDFQEKLEDTSTRVVLEEQDGPVSVYFRAKIITVRQRVPVFGGDHPEPNTVAATLGLALDDLHPFPPRVVSSSGVPFLIVAAKEASLLERIRFRSDIWERTIRHFEAPNIAVFAISSGKLSLRARVFLPALGVPEDPATESASGPIIAYALSHGLFEPPEQFVASVHQGQELERPSVIQISVAHEQGVIRQIQVGGQCQIVGEGRIVAPVVDSISGMR